MPIPLSDSPRSLADKQIPVGIAVAAKETEGFVSRASPKTAPHRETHRKVPALRYSLTAARPHKQRRRPWVSSCE